MSDFFAHQTIEQLAAAQGVGPITDASALAGVIPDDEIEEFVAEIYGAR